MKQNCIIALLLSTALLTTTFSYAASAAVAAAAEAKNGQTASSSSSGRAATATVQPAKADYKKQFNVELMVQSVCKINTCIKAMYEVLKHDCNSNAKARLEYFETQIHGAVQDVCECLANIDQKEVKFFFEVRRS